MTSPIESVTVLCPQCGKVHETCFRPSMNLLLDDFDDEYIEEMSTTHCPHCGIRIELGALVIRKDGWEVR